VAQLARFLLGWLAAFAIVVTLFSAFGRQLEAMSLQVRALTMSGVLVVAMNFFIMPTVTRLLSRFLRPPTVPGPDSPG
jgi:antibiotic biosynthesis monooxygenase (ABM) superfamily enzyme